jgi:hypothetical protein
MADGSGNAGNANSENKKDEATPSHAGKKLGWKAVCIVACAIVVVALCVRYLPKSAQDANDVDLVDEGTVVQGNAATDAAAPFAADSFGGYARQSFVIAGSGIVDCGDRVLYANDGGSELAYASADGKDQGTIPLPEQAPDGTSGIYTVDSLITYDGRVYVGYHYNTNTSYWECAASMAPDGSDMQTLLEVEADDRDGHNGGSIGVFLTIADGRLYADYRAFDEDASPVSVRVAMGLDGSGQQTVANAGGSVADDGHAWSTSSEDSGASEKDLLVHRTSLEDPADDAVVYQSGDLSWTSNTVFAIADGTYYHPDDTYDGLAHVSAFDESGLVGTVDIDPKEILGDDVEVDKADVELIDVQNGKIYLTASYSVEQDTRCSSLISCNLDGTGMCLLHNFRLDSGEPYRANPSACIASADRVILVTDAGNDQDMQIIAVEADGSGWTILGSYLQ